MTRGVSSTRSGPSVTPSDSASCGPRERLRRKHRPRQHRRRRAGGARRGRQRRGRGPGCCPGLAPQPGRRGRPGNQRTRLRPGRLLVPLPRAGLQHRPAATAAPAGRTAALGLDGRAVRGQGATSDTDPVGHQFPGRAHCHSQADLWPRCALPRSRPGLARPGGSQRIHSRSLCRGGRAPTGPAPGGPVDSPGPHRSSAGSRTSGRPRSRLLVGRP